MCVKVKPFPIIPIGSSYVGIGMIDTAFTMTDGLSTITWSVLVLPFSTVDTNDEYDSLDIRERDEQERYFDKEDPETVDMDTDSHTPCPSINNMDASLSTQAPSDEATSMERTNSETDALGVDDG